MREHAADATGQPHRLEQLDAARSVADERSVRPPETPRQELFLLPEPGEKLRRLGIAQRKERQLLPPVE